MATRGRSHTQARGQPRGDWLSPIILLLLIAVVIAEIAVTTRNSYAQFGSFWPQFERSRYSSEYGRLSRDRAEQGLFSIDVLNPIEDAFGETQAIERARRAERR